MIERAEPAQAHQTPLKTRDEPVKRQQLNLASELFHRVNRVIPEDQTLLTISPETTAREAIALMAHHRFSQLPVVSAGRVLGVFSHRSYGVGSAALSRDELNQQRIAPGDLRADEFLEQFRFARVDDEIVDLFDDMDRDNGLIIGTPEHAVGILTPMDFLRYLNGVTAPFIYLSEIELALRALIRAALAPEVLEEVANASLAQLYEPKPPPTDLAAMTFDNYVTLVGFGGSWHHFDPIVGPSRHRVSGKLQQIRDLRNIVFHFKRELEPYEVDDLRALRHWLLSKVEQIGAQNPGGEK